MPPFRQAQYYTPPPKEDDNIPDIVLPDEDQSEEQPTGILDTIGKKAKKLLEEHPVISRFLSGPSDEDINKNLDPAIVAKRKELGITGVAGPPTSDSLLPEAKHGADEGWPAYLAKGAYNQLIRPVASSTGVLGTLSPVKEAPIGDIAAEVPKPRLALPPAPEGTPKPSFIAGPGGVAKNEPHAVSLGDISPVLGQGTPGNISFKTSVVPPEILAGHAPVPEGPESFTRPEYNVGTGNLPAELPSAVKKSTQIEPKLPDIEGELSSVIPSSPMFNGIRDGGNGTVYVQFSGKNVAPEDVKAMFPNHNIEVTKFNPKADILRPDLQKFRLDVSDENGNNSSTAAKSLIDSVGGEFTDWNPETPDSGFTTGVKSEPKLPDIEPEDVPELELPKPDLKDLTMQEALERWGHGRNASRFSADQIKQQFADLKNLPVEDRTSKVMDFQEGNREGPLKDVAAYFDDRFKQLVKAGVLDPEDYKQNYLKQLWEDKPEKVDAVFNKSGIASEPGLSKESIFKSYRQGIEAGLTPKYDNLADISGAFEKEFNDAIRDKEFTDYLESQGVKVRGSISDNSTIRQVARIDPDAARDLSNYFSTSPDAIHKTADVVSATKNLALTQGIPYRTGQFSAHGYNLLKSDVMAQGFKAGLSDYFKGSVNPETDISYIKQNSPMIKKLIENGMNWTNIEDHSALSTDKVSTLVDKIPLIGDLNVWRRKAFEDPLFQVHLPATKLRIALNRYQELLPKVGDEEALKAAASYANDFAGGVDKTFRNKTLQDLARIGLLAPDWLESRFNIAKGVLTGKPGYLKPAARGLAMTAVPVGAGIAAKGVTGYLNSKPAESTGIPLGTTSNNKQRNLEPLGTAVEPFNSAVQIGTQLAQGNPGEFFRYAKNKLSPVVQAGMDLGSNVDPLGNPLYGKDRFGKPIPMGRAALNIGKEVTRPFTPGFIQALEDYLSGQDSVEEVGVKGAGLPITYTTNPKAKKTSSKLPELRLP